MLEFRFRHTSIKMYKETNVECLCSGSVNLNLEKRGHEK